jgi:hypothetical protein
MFAVLSHDGMNQLSAVLEVQMLMLIFALGVLLGVLFGGGLCVRYLRREIAADIGPQLRQIKFQIETVESVLNFALVSRYAELTAPPIPRVNDPD